MWENKIGGAAADVLTGKNGINDLLNGLSGTDTLKGLDGNDVLIGGSSQDVLTGGIGRDVFVFNTLTDSATRAPDVITDFEMGRDEIDLSTLDAIKGTALNDPFKFIGNRAFGAVKGELHYVRTDKSGTIDDKTFIEGDINGDGKADFRIEIKGLVTLAESDFIL
jgi:Ca2+-binding RTX toxin-like protein